MPTSSFSPRWITARVERRPSSRVRPTSSKARSCRTPTRAPKGLDVRIDDEVACPRFAAALLTGVRIGPSPTWMQERLIAAGMRPIDNVVDITNYVMLELGQPLHAYDHRQLRDGVLVARAARRGETIRTLDGIDRVLPERTLVIAGGQRAPCTAGLLGRQ